MFMQLRRSVEIHGLFWCVAIVIILTATTAIAVTPKAQEPSTANQFDGLFAVYQNNRDQGIPNYITLDLLLLAYSMIRDKTITAVEQNTTLPLLKTLINVLAVKVANAKTNADTNIDTNTDTGAGVGTDGAAIDTDTNVAANLANRDYFAILTALLNGKTTATAAGVPKRAQAELDLVLAAVTLTESPLWVSKIDYTHFKPRGHYVGQPELEAFFRTVAYAGAVLFAVQESKATGINTQIANRMAAQAFNLATWLTTDKPLAATYRQLQAQLSWRFGPAEDMPNTSLTMPDGIPKKFDADVRKRWLTTAQTNNWQPRIASGIVAVDMLEQQVTVKDVLTGWRLLPQRYTPDSAAFQQLVYANTGEFQATCKDCNPPFGLTVINGKLVKGFPLALEWLALLGSKPAQQKLIKAQENLFEGYAKSWQKAKQDVARATGLSLLHAQLMQTGLTTFGPDIIEAERQTAMRAFWTWQRYLSVLYVKQSYTGVGKSIRLPKSRDKAWLEPAITVYQSLLRVVSNHQQRTPHQLWDKLAELLERVVRIAWYAQNDATLTADDIEFLNGLDRDLFYLVDAQDHPIIVDVHTNAATQEVLQEATGKPMVVYAITQQTQARGARFSQCEFKMPMDKRLTNDAWQAKLQQSDTVCGR